MSSRDPPSLLSLGPDLLNRICEELYSSEDQ